MNDFEKLDKNNNGSIEPDEFKALDLEAGQSNTLEPVMILLDG